MSHKCPKRILFYIGSLLAGGKERRLLELLSYLKAHTPLDMMLVITDDKIHYKGFQELGIPIEALYKDREEHDPLIFNKFYRLCKAFRPDIIHTWGSKQTFYALPAAIGLKIPLVNSQIASAPPHISPWSLNTWISRINFCFSTLILSNSMAGITAYHPPQSKSKVIHNGISLDRFQDLPKKSVVKAKYNITTPYLVIMSASFSPNKDHRFFLKIAEIITSTRDDISFIGVGAHDTNNPAYNELVQKSAHNPRILFPGRIDDVEALVNASDIGVLFSNSTVHGEGISNSILEYMALGKPVIANDAGGTKELVQHQKNGYLITDQTENEIVQMILELIDDKAKRQRLGAEGRKLTHQCFSIAKMGYKFVNAYQEILKVRI